jgi:hypothetical protein
MLGSAVSKLSEEIDTFQVDSLPESYRKTFSAGGDWVDERGLDLVDAERIS